MKSSCRFCRWKKVLESDIVTPLKPQNDRLCDYTIIKKSLWQFGGTRAVRYTNGALYCRNGAMRNQNTSIN